jgi:hypothetical protein
MVSRVGMTRVYHRLGWIYMVSRVDHAWDLRKKWSTDFLWPRIHAPGKQQPAGPAQGIVRKCSRGSKPASSRGRTGEQQLGSSQPPPASTLCAFSHLCLSLCPPACLWAHGMPLCHRSRSRSAPPRVAYPCRSCSVPPRLGPRPPARSRPAGSHLGARLLLQPTEGLAPSSNLHLFFIFAIHIVSCLAIQIYCVCRIFCINFYAI